MIRIFFISLIIFSLPVSAQISLPRDNGVTVSFHDTFDSPLTAYEACDILEKINGIECSPSAIPTAFSFTAKIPIFENSITYFIEFNGIINAVYKKISYSFTGYKINSIPIEEWEEQNNSDENSIKGKVFAHTVWLIVAMKDGEKIYNDFTRK